MCIYFAKKLRHNIERNKSQLIGCKEGNTWILETQEMWVQGNLKNVGAHERWAFQGP